MNNFEAVMKMKCYSTTSMLATLAFHVCKILVRC